MFRILTVFSVFTASLFLRAESETGQTQLKAGRERSYHQEEYEDSGFITTTVHNEGYNRIKVIEPIMVYDDVRVIGRLITEVKKGRLAPWVVDLCAMYDVDLREVLETHEQWYHHTTQMSMPLRTFLSVALTICTAGWGADYITAHWANASTAVAKGVGAALEGITNTFIVSTIADGGDLGKVFKELTDSRYLKGLVASALASGLVSKFVDKPIADKALKQGNESVKTAVNTATKAGKSTAGVGLAAQNAAIKNLSFAQNLGRNLRAAALTTGVTTAISGGKFGRNALSGLGAAAVNTVSANLAHQIGERYAHGSGDMSWLTHKVCHFVLGGTAAEFTGGDFLAGGTGATVGEMVADAMIQRALEQTRAEVREQLDDFRNTYGELPTLQEAEALVQLTYLEHLEAEQAEQIQRIGRLVAAGTALIGRMDINTADAAADLAIEYNSIASQIKALKTWLGANYKQITYDGVNFIIPVEAIANLAQGKDIASSLAEIGLTLTPIGKAGKCLKFLAVKALGKNGKPLIGAYKITKGHHIFAKRAFWGHAKYDAKNGLCISEDMIKILGGDHKKFTAAQRRLFTDFAKSGRPNTLAEHTRIAVEWLVEGNIDRGLARDIVAAALKDLKRSGVKFPTDIPWKSVIKDLKK